MAKRRPSGDGMVRKREDGRWEGRIVVGHKENGEPIFRYVLAKTQKELLAKLHRDMDIYQDAQLTEDSRMTLGEWLDRWMEEYGAVTLRPNTLRSYEQYIRCYVKPYLGGKIVSRVTRLDIQKLYRKLKKEGRVHDHPEYGHELSDSMVLRIHAMLHRCLKDAERDHIVPYNPTDGVKLPKSNYKPKQVLDREQMDAFLAAVDKNEIWRDFFYTELTTGLRRGEICGLMWRDFDENAGTLKILRSVNVPKRGEMEIGETKTERGRRTIRLPPSTVQRLKERKKHAVSQWIFPEPLAPEKPVRPSAAYYWMKVLLKEAGLPHIRFHDLRHTFATMALENGMDIKTLSAMLGHVSAATTLDIYTHITSDMLSEAAAKIDRGLGNEVAEDSAEANPLTDFQPVMRRTRKPGTGCITEINDHLFEGRYSPTWPDGTKHSKCIYAHTREECEEKLKVLIQQLNTERKAIQDRMRGIPSPEKLTKKQRPIWEYMRLCPDETNYSTIAKGAKVTRHTVAKHFEMIQKMLGIQKTAPHPLLDCQTVPLIV